MIHVSHLSLGLNGVCENMLKYIIKLYGLSGKQAHLEGEFLNESYYQQTTYRH